VSDAHAIKFLIKLFAKSLRVWAEPKVLVFASVARLLFKVLYLGDSK